MAKEIQLYTDLDFFPGKSIYVNVYDVDGNQVGGDIALTEESPGIFIGDMPAADEGSYGVRFFFSIFMIAQGEIHWDGTKEVTVLDSADAGGGLTEATLNASLNSAISNIQVGSLIGSKSKTDR